MIDKVFAYVKKYRMIEEGDTIAAGISGGADSVCLLFVLMQLQKKIPFHLVVVHVNHGIRPEAGEDAAYVEALCQRWQLPFYLVKEDVKVYAKENSLSEEEAGRKIRYQAFGNALKAECLKRNAVAEETNLQNAKIAVAHNSNDRAETMLFHLFRGTGLSGLGSIRPVSGNVIRPLLCASRKEIENWLVQNEISWKTDSTNEKDDYTRNRIRHHILPFAEKEICSGAVIHMNRAADDLQAAEAFIQKETACACKRCVESKEIENERQMIIKLVSFRKEDPYLQGRILLSCLETLYPGRKDITSEHIANIRKLTEKNGSGEIQLPYGICVYKEYDLLILRKRSGEEKLQRNEFEKSPEEYPVLTEGKMNVSGLGCVETTVFSYEKTENIPRKTYTKWFDYDKITGSVMFRVRKAGDYLTINSRMDHKSLQDYFVNEKIPKAERDTFYVLADGAHIMWVPGYRISEHYKVSENTKTVLEVKVITDTEEERSHRDG